MSRFGVFSENFAIYTPQKPNILYIPPTLKKIGPLPAWALGRRTSKGKIGRKSEKL